MTDKIGIPGARYGLDMSFDDRAKIERDASTERILNEAAKRAGLTTGVHVTGDDVTYAETKAEQRPWQKLDINSVGTSASALMKLGEAFEVFGEATVGAAALELGGIVLEPAMAGHDLVQAWLDGDERKEALAKDMMHVALLVNLNVPEDYKAAELAKRPEVTGRWDAPTQIVGEKLSQHPEMKIILQLRCDEGMHAAVDVVSSGRPLQEYLKQHPDVSERFHLDAAFRTGFDAMMWSKEQGAQQFQSTVKDLHSRDVRFHADRNMTWSA